MIWFYPIGIAYLIYRVIKHFLGQQNGSGYAVNAGQTFAPPASNVPVNNGYKPVNNPPVRNNPPVNNGYRPTNTPVNNGYSPNNNQPVNNGFQRPAGGTVTAQTQRPHAANMANGSPAYSGSEPYIFISYAHADSAEVVPIIKELNNNGFRVWYDVGIEAGTEWPQYIAEHLDAADCVIAFITDSAVNSHNCRREINFAIELKKEMLVIYLKETELPLGMRLQLNTLQAMFKYRCEDDESFYNELFRAKILENCRQEGAAEQAAQMANNVSQNATQTANNTAKNNVADSVKDPTVLYNMGVTHYEGKLCKTDYDKAFSYFSSAAAQGHVDAQNYLGVCYEKGHGTAQNAVKAVEWYRKAAAMNNKYAQNNLGYCYERGSGVEQDLASAVKWYTLSANQGYMLAQHNLGYMYDTGRGVQQDLSMAFSLYEKAAAQGHAPAQNNLGVCYQNGRGVAADPVKAVDWYRKAASQNFALAQSNLALCYQNGIGVEQNDSMAMQWFERSAANNS